MQFKSKVPSFAALFLLAMLFVSPVRGADPVHVWQGSWIWDRAPVPEANVYSYFRKTFSLTAAPTGGAKVFMSADSRYLLYVNGTYVGRGPVRAPAGRIYYDTYDIQALLRPGANTIAVLVHFFGQGTESYLLGQGALLLDAEITPTPGAQPMVIQTDSTWKTLRSAAWDSGSPRENDSNGFLEIFDFRLEPAGWNQNGFSDANWTTPFVIGPPPQNPWPALLPRDIPFLTETAIRPYAVASTGQVARLPPADAHQIAQQVQSETVAAGSSVVFSNLSSLSAGTGGPATVQTPVSGQDAVVVLDYGRVVAGFPYIDVEGAAGVVVDVTFSEGLNLGRVPAVRAPVTFLTYTGRQMYTTDRVTLRDGRQRWQRMFHSGFRYVQLTVRGAALPVKIYAAGAVFHAYPFVTKGSFQSSDAVINSIWSTGAYTVQLSTADVFMDCPWREKGQWIDMVAPLVSHNVFDDKAIAARYLRTTSLTQDAQGRMGFPYPSSIGFEMPDQTMWWGAHLWQYYMYFGDTALLQELYPVVANAEAWFKQHRSTVGLLDASWSFTSDRLLWPWIDHGHRAPNNLPGIKLGQMAALDALHYKFLNDAANIAQVTNHISDANQYIADAQQLKTDINAAYWDPALNFYWDDVAHTIRGDYASVLAVLYGINPSGTSQTIMTQVLDSDYRMGVASPHFYFFVLDALAKAGMYDTAMGAIKRRWSDFFAQGATTFWELWSLGRDLFGRPWPPGQVPHISLVHGYSAAPTYFLSTNTLGVRPLSPGFYKFSIAPSVTSLDWAGGAVPSPWGTIQVSWQKAANGAFTLSARIPGGTTASVSLPRGAQDQVSVNGTVVWRAGAAVANSSPVRVVGPSGTRLILDAPAGLQQFLSQ